MIWQFINQFSESHFANSSNFLTFFGFVTTLVVIYGGFQFWKSRSAWRKRRTRLIKFAATLPGPREWPILGSALQFACKAEDILDRIVEIATRYDSVFRIWLGPQLMLVTTNPRDYEIILGSSKASHKPAMYRFMEPFVGLGLLTDSGTKHKAHRKVIMSMMNRKALGVFSESFDRHSRTCVELLEKKADSGEFDILSYMTHVTTEITLETLMGTSINRQSSEYKQLLHWTDKLYHITHERLMKVWLHADQIFYRTQRGKLTKEGADIIHGFFENAIERKRKEHYSLLNETEEPARPRVMLIEQLITHIEEANDFNDIELRDEMITMHTAAQDTTATLCAFACVLLAMHPEIQDKARAEVMDVIGNESIDEKKLANLSYLEMVIRENIRLHPIGPVMLRELTGDIVLDKCTLPEGCTVAMIPFVTHRDSAWWKDPNSFIPERFLPENSKGRPQFANAAFSGGFRSCIGQKYAVMLMKTVLAHILRRFRLSTSTKLENLRLKTDISIRSRDGYKLSLTKIES